MTVAYLLKHDKFGSNLVLTKQNLPNLIILPPKNGGFKARSHSVRKANLFHIRISMPLPSVVFSSLYISNAISFVFSFTSLNYKDI